MGIIFGQILPIDGQIMRPILVNMLKQALPYHPKFVGHGDTAPVMAICS